MTTIAVTCIKNGRTDTFGRPLVSGTYYPSIEREHARALWNSGYVSVADASVFDDDPLAGTSPLDDFNVARALAITRQPTQTSANLAAELAAVGVQSAIWNSGLPFVVFPGDGGSNGLLVAANGAFSLSAAPLTGLSTPRGYMYLPASAGGLGNTEGWHYFTMSSSTAGIIYDNKYDPALEGTTGVPTTLAPFTNGSGSRITQSTSELTAITRTITLGASGSIKIDVRAYTSAGGSRFMFTRAGATALHLYQWSGAGNSDGSVIVQNTGAQSEQVSTRSYQFAGTQQTSVNGDFTTVDFSVPTALTVSMKIGVAATDTMVMFIPRILK